MLLGLLLNISRIFFVRQCVCVCVCVCECECVGVCKISIINPVSSDCYEAKCLTQNKHSVALPCLLSDLLSKSLVNQLNLQGAGTVPECVPIPATLEHSLTIRIQVITYNSVNRPKPSFLILQMVDVRE
jgi:hypothetical protein